MKPREVLSRIRELGGRKLRQTGSHVSVCCKCGKYKTTVPGHKGKDVKKGTLSSIQRALAPCFGEKWLLGT